MPHSFFIRPLRLQDADSFAEDFAAQGWSKPKEQFLQYFAQQQNGQRIIAVAEVGGRAAGYACLLERAKCGPFAAQNIPEIKDFNVLQKHQRQGIGSAILDFLEQTAAQTHDCVSLGVGMHSGYGQAWRLYVRRGYFPSGDGVWYQDKPLAPYAPCCNDDDLVFYLKKQLTGNLHSDENLL